MFQKILSHPVAYLAISACAIMGVLVCIFPHYFPSISWGVNYAIQLMLIYLAGGLVFLFLKQPRLTFVCFAASAVLCFFLKYSVKSDGIERWRQTVIKSRMNQALPVQEPSLKLAQLNITNVVEPAEMLSAIKKAGADILSVHEVTPDWEQWLNDSLGKLYPYHHSLVDIGIFGMAIYSRYELQNTDTFYYENIPNLRTCLELNGNPLCMISIHTEPALNSFSLRRLREHLALAADELKRMEKPLLVFGDFNAVTWSDEIRVFMDSTGLQESRTGFITGGFPLEVPLDHIFHSRHLRCDDFWVLKSPSRRHLGIMGMYRFNQTLQNVKKTAQ